MLTATYTLVALSVEQASMRMGLLALQKQMQSTLTLQRSLSLSQLEYACENLNRLYDACHWRKIEKYLIPALRQATEKADQLLDELSLLNQNALTAIRQMQAQMENASEDSEERVAEVCAAIDTFCESLLQRLDKEERELFAIARRAICGDAWFAIANQMLAHEAEAEEARRERAARPLSLARPAAIIALGVPGLDGVAGQETQFETPEPGSHHRPLPVRRYAGD
ncbi:hemerythrin domain-containing protein [Pseudoduganella violacea]|uniref:Hemerythrin-like domain-containing protein n=1 Tax=Pseudoduganella violacea TaxID=1715466 RepID=A0A7W5BEH5_9BURK|nr:hemerythrin domain-containing protein [Pseudoduganella violacea]MBB3121648.1 hemerythrin-like domain-containing protein [Pseudoduganella violacea]